MTGHRDLALEHFAADEADLLEQIVDLEIENRGLRDVLHVAVDLMRDVSADRDRLRDSHHRLISEFRTFREIIMRQTIGEAP